MCHNFSWLCLICHQIVPRDPSSRAARTKADVKAKAFRCQFGQSQRSTAEWRAISWCWSWWWYKWNRSKLIAKFIGHHKYIYIYKWSFIFIYSNSTTQNCYLCSIAASTICDVQTVSSARSHGSPPAWSAEMPWVSRPACKTWNVRWKSNWNMLKHAETCWNMLKHAETCWNMLKRRWYAPMPSFPRLQKGLCKVFAWKRAHLTSFS